MILMPKQRGPYQVNLNKHVVPLRKPIVKLDINADVAGLRSKLEKHPEYFGELRYRSVLGMDDMKDIWVRFNDIAPFVAKGSN